MNARAIFAMSMMPLGLLVIQIPVLGAEFLTAVMVLVYVVSGPKYVAFSSVVLLLSNVSGLEQIFGMGMAVMGVYGGFLLFASVFAFAPLWWTAQCLIVVRLRFLQPKGVRRMLSTLGILKKRWR